MKFHEPDGKISQGHIESIKHEMNDDVLSGIVKIRRKPKETPDPHELQVIVKFYGKKEEKSKHVDESLFYLDYSEKTYEYVGEGDIIDFEVSLPDGIDIETYKIAFDY